MTASELVDRVQHKVAVALTLSHVAGAVITFVFLTVVLPVRHPPPVSDVFVLNGPVGAFYVILASIFAPRVGRRLGERSVGWIRDERKPTAGEQRKALRSTLQQLWLAAVLWGLAAVVFGLINLHFSAEIGGRVAGGIVMGGLVTCAIAYLAGERVWRPITARALEAGVPERPVAPGVIARTVLAWGLATGVPLIAIGWVAAGVINGDTPRNDATAWSVIFLVAVGLAAGAAGIVAAAKSIAHPIGSVRRALARVEAGDTDVEVTVDDASEVGLLQAGFNRMAAGLRERERLRDLFGRHVGEDVARQALEAGVELRGEVREAAVVFVDVVGSTALAAARELARRIEAESPLEAGVGVSAGEVVAGNVGAAARYEYTVIGDPVNEAARLTELAKDRRPRVLASGTAVLRAGPGEADRWMLGDTITLRGRAEPTALAIPAESAVPTA